MCVCERERREERREAASRRSRARGSSSAARSASELSRRASSAALASFPNELRAKRIGEQQLVHYAGGDACCSASRSTSAPQRASLKPLDSEHSRERARVCVREREREHSIERHTHRSRGVCLGRYWRGWRRLARCRKRRRPRWTCNRLLLLLLLRTNDCARLLLALHRHLFLRLLVERRGVWWRAARPRRRCAWRWA